MRLNRLRRKTDMPTPERLRDFIATCERGEFVEALEQFYADDATMRENGEPPRVGLPALIENEKRMLARARFDERRAASVTLGPFPPTLAPPEPTVPPELGAPLTPTPPEPSCGFDVCAALSPVEHATVRLANALAASAAERKSEADFFVMHHFSGGVGTFALSRTD
jgi:hypothetical protein